MAELQAKLHELPGEVKHAAEEAWGAVVGEVAALKQHWRDDILASEQNLKDLLRELPGEFTNLVQTQLRHLTDGMAGLNESIQSEFGLMKSHVTGIKDHVSQRVRNAS